MWHAENSYREWADAAKLRRWTETLPLRYTARGRPRAAAGIDPLADPREAARAAITEAAPHWALMNRCSGAGSADHEVVTAWLTADADRYSIVEPATRETVRALGAPDRAGSCPCFDGATGDDAEALNAHALELVVGGAMRVAEENGIAVQPGDGKSFLVELADPRGAPVIRVHGRTENARDFALAWARASIEAAMHLAEAHDAEMTDPLSRLEETLEALNGSAAIGPEARREFRWLGESIRPLEAADTTRCSFRNSSVHRREVTTH